MGVYQRSLAGCQLGTARIEPYVPQPRQNLVTGGDWAGHEPRSGTLSSMWCFIQDMFACESSSATITRGSSHFAAPCIFLGQPLLRGHSSVASSASRSSRGIWSSTCSRVRAQPVCGDKPEIDWDSAWQNVKKSIPSAITDASSAVVTSQCRHLLQVLGRLQCISLKPLPTCRDRPEAQWQAAAAKGPTATAKLTA